MKELARNEAIGKMTLFPGDRLIASYNGNVVARYEIDKPMVVDTLVIVEPEQGELGLKGGIGAIFGKKA